MNRKKLEEWLQDKPQEVVVAIAARAALRSLPFLSRLIRSDGNLEDHLTSWMRCVLTSGVASTYPTPEVKRAARAADADADAAAAAARAAGAAAADAAAAAAARTAAARTAAAAAARAADAAAAAAAADAAIWQEVSQDVSFLEAHGRGGIEALMRRPVWGDGTPGFMAEPLEAFHAYLSERDSLSFWARWYQGISEGRPLNWEMQQEIALIPDDIWSEGAEAVSKAIAAIEAKYTPQSLPKELLRAQVLRLMDQASAAELSTLELADRIETALMGFARECGNELPEKFQILERMPRTLRTIGSLASSRDSSQESISALEAKVEAFAEEIQILSERLAEAEAKCATGAFKKSFLEQSGKSLGDWKLYGAIISGGYMVLGGDLFGVTLNSFGEAAKGIFKGAAEAKPALPQIGR